MFLHFSDLPDSKSKLVSLSFRNFKPFKSWQKFEPAQINLLIGPNNSGKSSLIEFLRILGGNFPESLSTSELPLREKKFDKLLVDENQPLEIKAIIETNVIKNKKIKKFISESSAKDSFEVYIKYQKSSDTVLSPVFLQIEHLNSKRMLVDAISDKNGNKFNVNWASFYSDYIKKIDSKIPFEQILLDKGIVNNSDKEYNIRQSENLLQALSSLTWNNVPDFDGSGSNYGFDFKAMVKDDLAFIINLQNAAYDTVEEQTHVYEPDMLQFGFQSHLELENISKKHHLKNDQGKRIGYNYKELGKYIENYFQLLNELFDIFKHTIPSVKFLPVERLGQKKVYYTEDFNDYGSWMKKDLKGDEKKVITKWLKRFGIANDISKLDYTDDVFGIMVERHGKQIPLYMLGYGALQIVLLLLSSYNGRKRNSGALGRIPFNWPGSPESLMALEEPEANLHPKLQSQLADLFAEVIKVNRESFIIETHSEYLIRKLQYLIAKGDLKASDLSITYFEEIKPNAKTGKLRTIRIRKDGMLMDDFGAGFFDESARWTFELFKEIQEN